MSENDAVNQQAGAWFAVLDAIAESNPMWWDQKDLTGKECAVKAIKDMAARIAELEAQVQALRDDAERYRWLRRNVGVYRTDDGKGPVSTYLLCQTPAKDPIAEETDAAIDAARAAKG